MFLSMGFNQLNYGDILLVKVEGDPKLSTVAAVTRSHRTSIFFVQNERGKKLDKRQQQPILIAIPVFGAKQEALS